MKPTDVAGKAAPALKAAAPLLRMVAPALQKRAAERLADSLNRRRRARLGLPSPDAEASPAPPPSRLPLVVSALLGTAFGFFLGVLVARNSPEIGDSEIGRL